MPSLGENCICARYGKKGVTVEVDGRDLMPHPVVDPQVVLVLDGGTSEGQLKLGKKISTLFRTIKQGK